MRLTLGNMSWAVAFAAIAGCTQVPDTRRTYEPARDLLPAGAVPVSLQAPQIKDPRPLVPPLEGQVAFPADRKVQAAAVDVVSFAMVGIMDTDANYFAASTVSEFNGKFKLSLGNWLPELNKAYVVEATKGLQSNKPGNENPRFRTIVRWNGTAWESASTPAIVISNLTTAVAVYSHLYPTQMPAASTMNKVNSSVSALNPNPRWTYVTDGEILKTALDINKYLAADLDPVGGINDATPSISVISTDSARPNDIIEIKGSGFSPLAANNTVTFGGVPANVLLATPTRMLVYVPSGGVTGSLSIKTSTATSAGVGFAVQPAAPTFSIRFLFPSTGTPGTDMTILGFGFSKVPSENTVKFGTVTTQCASSDVDFCTVKIPGNAVSGKLSVVVGAGESNQLPYSVIINPTINKMFPTSGAPGEYVTISGSNLGSSGSVAVSGVAAPIVSWGDTEVVALAPFNSVPGQLSVTKLGGSAVNVGSFGMLGGSIASWVSTANNTYSHQGGWHGRRGEYMYMGGGYATCCGPTGYLKQTERAKINPDGTIGAWETLNGIEVPYYWNMYAGDPAHQATIIGDYGYIMSGYNPSDGRAHNTVLRARFFNDGSMSAFSANPSGNLAVNIAYVSYIMRVKDYVYVLGGHGNNEPNTDAVQGAKINPDGSLQAFSVRARLPFWCYGCQFAQVGKFIYLLGGYNGGHFGSVYRAPINDDGSFAGSFGDTGKPLPCDMYSGNVADIGPYIYLFYGYSANCGSWTNGRVYRAQKGADGSLGGWEQVSGQPYGKHYANVVTVGSRVYVDGAYDGNHRPNIDVGTIQ
jgi:hypothetical protein